jgi:hypothetical protein
VLPVMLFGQYNKLSPLSSYARKGSFGTGTQYWTKSSATGFDFGTSTDFSIVMLFKTTSAATLQRLISKKANATGAGDPGFMVEIRTSKISPVFGDAAASTSALSNTVLTNGTVYHLVITATRTGSAVIYINGTLDNSFAISGVGSVNNALTLGVGANTNGNNPVIGTIGRVQVISGKAFTAAEVSALYNKQRSEWPKSYPGGSTVMDIDWKKYGRDQSSSVNTLTPVNSPYIATF